MNPGDEARYAINGGKWGIGTIRRLCSGVTSDGHVVDFLLLNIVSEEGFEVISATEPETGWQICASTFRSAESVARKARDVISGKTFEAWRTKIAWAMEKNKEEGRG